MTKPRSGQAKSGEDKRFPETEVDTLDLHTSKMDGDFGQVASKEPRSTPQTKNCKTLTTEVNKHQQKADKPTHRGKSESHDIPKQNAHSFNWTSIGSNSLIFKPTLRKTTKEGHKRNQTNPSKNNNKKKPLHILPHDEILRATINTPTILWRMAPKPQEIHKHLDLQQVSDPNQDEQKKNQQTEKKSDP